MSIVELILIGIGLGMDACSVAICKGLSMNKKDYKKAIIISLYFSIFQFIMPIIGYYFGYIFGNNLKIYSHLISFILLILLGINMIKESFNKDHDILDDNVNFKVMLIPSIATSIDALSIGITFSLLDINIFISCILIFIITFILSFIGTIIGQIFGIKYKNKSLILGGVILMIMGLKILY